MNIDTEHFLRSQKELAVKIEKLLINFKKDGPARKTAEYLESRLSNLELMWDNFNKFHNVLEKNLEADHAYLKEGLYEKTEQLYTSALKLIKDSQASLRVLATKTQQEVEGYNPTPSISHNEEKDNIQPQTSSCEQLPVAYLEANRINNLPKLPPIKIPKFNGDYKEWKSFIDIFLNVIHNNYYLSKVEKMQYLLYHLEGDAKKVISHLQLCSNNYDTALQLIQGRFNNNRKIISTYINAIMDTKKVEHRCQEDIITLYDTLRECLEALKNFNCNTDEWGPIIVCIVMRKLDAESLRLFEEGLLSPREMPSTEELFNFLEKRYQVLDCIKSSKLPRTEAQLNYKKKAFHATVKRSCIFCNKDHNIYQCTEFKKIDPEGRNAFILQKNLCINCMAHKKSEKCKTNKTCFYCNKKHHTLLHRNSVAGESYGTGSKIVQKNINPERKAQPQNEDAVALHNKTKIPNVLLPTAMVRIKNSFGQIELYRALVDPGSQVSLITEDAVQTLRLHKERITTTILGVGEAQSAKAYSKVKIKLQLRYQKNTYLHVEALVLPKLNSLLPESPVQMIDMDKYENLVLADPTFNIPGPIDLLLGADVYANIILNGVKNEQPTAQNTKLGWIIFGKIPNAVRRGNTVSTFISTAEVDKKLEQFWEIDNELPHQSDNDCSEHYQGTHTRNDHGRYIVRLPFKENLGALGHSRDRALARLLQMEKKLKKSPSVMNEYNTFLAEYLTLGHMSPAKPYAGDPSKVYYLPHHAVFKEDSTTTKLRVVFDASCKTDSGISLNDILHNGPKIQQDLSQILLRWRKHRYVFTADLEKMFRQIELAKEDRNYQRILWRPQPNGPIKEFILNTVTYGTASATYLAVKTLQQLAEDEGNCYPMAKAVLTKDFYIDDMLSGADTKTEACNLQREIIALLGAGCFNLRKWTSNNEELLKTIPEDMLEKGILEINKDESIKTLGIHWNPKQDEFQFKIKLTPESNLTKRKLLAKISSIFDPLGLLAPVTITAKLIMQSLWKTETDWDSAPPTDIINQWDKLESELKDLQAIRIPRWIKYRKNQEIQLHGFSDASQKAYAAVVYARAVDSFGKIQTTILAAKTRVAPLKQKTTTPRLELCGALLVAELLKTCIDTLDIGAPTTFAWCDSEIVLAWISKNPDNLPTFMKNRVLKIQSLFDKSIWKYISTSENPADVASRGIKPSLLPSHNLWWRGPLWLKQSPEAWPSKKLNFVTNEEPKNTTVVLAATISIEETLKASTYTRQIRVIAYCLRFIKNCKSARQERNSGHLSTEELRNSENTIIRIVQLEAFSEEINALKKNKGLNNTSKLLSLHPFLDTDGILRVGGRLKHSNLPIDAKHQMLLPQKHHFTNLAINHAHRQTLHGGTQLTLNYLRLKFWIVDARRVVQGKNHKCVTCTRHSQKSPQPLMGDLPSTRIIPSPPFSSCGVDYAGPFLTKASKGKGIRTTKGYIALFVCMVTKAIHLELVTELSTDAFLAAYRRFISRRGNCKQIFSDNGTNFIGAKNKMDKDLKLAIIRSTKEAAERLANDGTDWKFIPVASPHFGGLWEAGVKSVKGHLKRALGETLLTYEEFSTVLCQVEACVNSRPIGQLSSDPRDLEPLTPGHFLIGRPLIAPPEPDIENEHLYQRWKKVTKLQQHFWKRWSQEYLSTLQQRSKWTTNGKNPLIGEIVLVMEDNLPPQKWSLGKIIELHPGDDGVVRVVSVQYRNTIKKRPLRKICQLPINIHNAEGEDSDHKPLTAMTTIASSIQTSSHSKKRNLQKGCHTEPELWSRAEHFDRINTSKASKRASTASDTGTKRKKVRIAPCTWASKLISSTLLIFYWLTLVFAKDYEIFQPKLGYYVENLGSAQIKRGNLRLQVTLQKEEILNDRKHIDVTWAQIDKLCEKTAELTEITHCQTLFQHLSSRRQHLLKAVDEILGLLDHKNRKKRGILGKILTSVFGVNEEVYNDIEILQQNQQDLLHLTNQQVLLLNMKINQSNFLVLEKLKQFDARLMEVTSSINEMASWYSRADHNRISIEVIATYISAEDYFDEIEEKYTNWLNALHNHGHLFDFVKLHDINNSIQKIAQKIGSNFLILTTPQERLEIRTADDSIKLYGYLNIVERTIYELIHVTPTPHIIKEDKLVMADIKFSTLAINFDQQTYFNLEEQQLKSCAIIADHVYLCTPTIVYSIQDSPSCVIDEIYERHPKTICEARQLTVTGTIWKALAMKNTWLYLSNETKPIAIICRGSRTELLLNRTGIIHLDDNCHINTREITLKTTLDESIDVVTSHMKEISLKAVNTTFTKPPLILQSGALIRPDEQILDFSLKPEPHTIILKRALIWHSVSMTTVVVALVIFILAWKYWENIKGTIRRCRSSSSPTAEDTIKHHFDRVLASGGPQHVHT